MDEFCRLSGVIPAGKT